MSSPLIGPGAMGSIASTHPRLSSTYKQKKTARSGIYSPPTSVRVDAWDAADKPTCPRVKSVTPSAEERADMAVLRKTGSGTVQITPEVIGRSAVHVKLPYVVIHDGGMGITNMRIYREAAGAAAVMIHNNRQPEQYMIYTEGQPYAPHAVQVKSAHAQHTAQPLISTSEIYTQDEVPGTAEQAPSNIVDSAYVDRLKAKLDAATQRAKDAFSITYDTVIVIEGFGEIEGTCDHYAINGKVLMLAYDDASRRNIPNPKPAEGKNIATFLMDIIDGKQKHIFELAAPFDSRFSFTGAGTAGVTFQQFMILQHQTVDC